MTAGDIIPIAGPYDPHAASFGNAPGAGVGNRLGHAQHRPVQGLEPEMRYDLARLRHQALPLPFGIEPETAIIVGLVHERDHADQEVRLIERPYRPMPFAAFAHRGDGNRSDIGGRAVFGVGPGYRRAHEFEDFPLRKYALNSFAIRWLEHSKYEACRDEVGNVRHGRRSSHSPNIARDITRRETALRRNAVAGSALLIGERSAIDLFAT